LHIIVYTFCLFIILILFGLYIFLFSIFLHYCSSLLSTLFTFLMFTTMFLLNVFYIVIYFVIIFFIFFYITSSFFFFFFLFFFFIIINLSISILPLNHTSYISQFLLSAPFDIINWISSMLPP